MIKVIEDCKIHEDRVFLQEPDGLETLRRIPWIKNFVPENKNNTECIVKGVTISPLTIRSSKKLPMYKKFDFSIRGRHYYGVLPFKDNGDGTYICNVDSFSDK